MADANPVIRAQGRNAMRMSGWIAVALLAAAAVAASGRPKEATDLDAVRKPAEVLRFLGLKRGDRVLDYFTGTGYYAEIMAKAVGPQGHVVGWNSSGFGRREAVVKAIKGIRERAPNTAFYSTPTTALSFAPN